eukprot:m.590040 g.590040  ORF g.590040 m.590040 type:complete len:293 (+) comp22374_c0_seq1:351-1229(+)
MAENVSFHQSVNRVAVIIGGAAIAAAYMYFSHTITRRKSMEIHDSTNSDGTSTLDTLPKAVLFGDSLTERSFEPYGWGAGLQHRFARRLSVRLAGFGGYNSRWAVAMLPYVFPVHNQPSKALFTTIWFGANDAAKESERVHVPIEEYAMNLKAIIGHVKKCSTHVLVITPPPVHHATRLKYQKEKYGTNATGVLERTNERAAAYAAAAVRVAVEENVPFLDLHSKFQQHKDVASLLCDGLHLSESGQREVLDAVLKTLRSESASHLLGETLPMQFPCHSDVHATRPDFTGVR